MARKLGGKVYYEAFSGQCESCVITIPRANIILLKLPVLLVQIMGDNHSNNKSENLLSRKAAGAKEMRVNDPYDPD